MDEDLVRLHSMSSHFAETIIRAYKLRFPTQTPDSKTITINSLLMALLSYLDTLEEVERANATEAVIQALFESIDE